MSPTYRAIDGKVRQAIAAVAAGKILLVDQAVIAGDLLDLGIEIEQVSALLLELLQDILPRHYVGTDPPLRSYEAPILNCELFAFKVGCKRTGCLMYLKFAVKNDFLWLVSLHEDRPIGKEQ